MTKKKKEPKFKRELYISVAILMVVVALAGVWVNATQDRTDDTEDEASEQIEDLPEEISEEETEEDVPEEPPEDQYADERRRVDEYRATVKGLQAEGEALPEYSFFVDAASLAAKIDDPRASYFARHALDKLPEDVHESDNSEVREVIANLEAIAGGDNSNWEVWPEQAPEQPPE